MTSEKTKLTEIGLTVQAILVFGSYATNTQRSQGSNPSDIDLLFLTDSFPDSFEAIEDPVAGSIRTNYSYTTNPMKINLPYLPRFL